MATFTIVTHCQQAAKHSAPVIPQSIRDRIPHSVFSIPQSIFTPTHQLFIYELYLQYQQIASIQCNIPGTDDVAMSRISVAVSS